MDDLIRQFPDLSPAKRALLEQQLRASGLLPVVWTIPRREARDSAPLSFAQQRLWFLAQLAPESASYNIHRAYHCAGPLDEGVLRRALDEIVRRHEVLRARFVTVGGEPVQRFDGSDRAEMRVVDLRGLPEDEREAEARRLAAQEAGRPFDLARGPLLRAALLRLGDGEHVLLLTLHHIVGDDWSTGILLKELKALYGAFVEGAPSPLSEPPIQYGDFAAWQRKWLDGEELARHLSYWKQKLAGSPGPLELPTDRPRPQVFSHRGARLSTVLSKALADRLKALSRQEGATLYMTLLAAWQALLARYAGQADVVVGSPIANRTRAETEGLIGFFANTLAMRTDVSGDPTFRELLARVREGALGAYAHQDLPFERLVEELAPERNLGRNPLFDVLFVLQNAPGGAASLSGLTLRPWTTPELHTRFDLEVYLREKRAGLACYFVYGTDLFDADTVRGMIRHYEGLLERVADDPEGRLSKLLALPAPEWRRVVVEWNATEAEYDAPACVHELFEEQSARTPDAVAVAFGDRRMTYRELDAAAGRLARHLKGLGVGPDTLVGLCLERSMETAVAVLGVLKAGGAYVPLDPAYPHKRLSRVLEDAKPLVVLTQRRLLERLPEGAGRAICLDDDWGRGAGTEPAGGVGCGAGPENLAYVLYTSGSTGAPKGVAMPHRALVNLVEWQRRNSRLGRGARTLQFTSLGFDVSFQEMFATWSTGGTLVLISEAARRDVEGLLDLLAEQEIERLFMPFVALRQLAEAYERRPLDTLRLREVITAGEQLQVTGAVREMFRRLAGSALVNQYGPTEAHVVSSYELAGDPGEWPALPPIGRPIANTRLYVLDERMSPVPAGVPGELYIGGRCLARGYLTSPEMTAERFVPDTFGREPGARLYRTGDRARWRADGTLEFLGRADDQVKIRGYRVEPGEIEGALADHPGVGEAAVIAREDGACVATPGVATPGVATPGVKRLVAYVVGSAGVAPAAAELRGWLGERLPEYMVPSAFVPLDALPLTPSGKVDRRALPEPERANMTDEAHVAPRTALEAQIVEIWEEVLKTRPIGVRDNFFELGGHSMLAVRMVYKVEQLCGRTLSLATLFTAATVEKLAGALEAGEADGPRSSLLRIRPEGGRRPFFCVSSPNVNALGYVALARHLDADQPVYVLQASNFKRMIPGDYTRGELAALAAEYIRAMREVQPTGPYLLGGMCAGATTAFEMARMLERQGEKVALLAIFDTWVLENTYSYAKFHLDYYYRRARTALRRRQAEQYRAVPELARRLSQRLRAAVRRGPGAPSAGRPRNPLRAVYWPGKEFTPETVSCRVTLFRVKDQPFTRIRDPHLGWDARSLGGVEAYVVPGDHATVLREPNVQALARKLAACILRSQKEADAKAVPSLAGACGAPHPAPDVSSVAGAGDAWREECPTHQKS
jgi:amino acid adenylation domain-containing protein